MTQQRELRPYPFTITPELCDAAFNTDAELIAILNAIPVDSSFHKLAQVTVKAQEFMRWGFGVPELPDNQGYMAFAAPITTANLYADGIIRLVWSNAAETQKGVVAEYATETLHNPTHAAAPATAASLFASSRESRQPVPVRGPRVQQDSKLIVEMRRTVAGTATHVGFQIPATRYQ